MTTHIPAPTLRDLALCLQALALEASAKLPHTPPPLARAVTKAIKATNADLLTATVTHLAGHPPDTSTLAAAAVRLRVARVYLDSIAAPPPPPQYHRLPQSPPRQQPLPDRGINSRAKSDHSSGG